MSERSLKSKILGNYITGLIIIIGYIALVSFSFGDFKALMAHTWFVFALFAGAGFYYRYTPKQLLMIIPLPVAAFLICFYVAAPSLDNEVSERGVIYVYAAVALTILNLIAALADYFMFERRASKAN